METVIHQGNFLEPWPAFDNSINCMLTSPPYWGLRDYKAEGQIGLEATPDEFIDKLVIGFREAHRVLKNDGTLWVNIGDCYFNNPSAFGTRKSTLNGRRNGDVDFGKAVRFDRSACGLKKKDLVGIPWMLAFAMRKDGWYLRQEIIWSKPNPMPESVKDRCTRSHESLFMFSKSGSYYYNHKAIQEPAIYHGLANQEENGYKKAKKFSGKHSDKQRGHSRRHNGFNDRWDKMTVKEQGSGMRNKRDVWTIAPAQYKNAHFAVMPLEMAVTVLKAGCPPRGCAADCFSGAGTTAIAAAKLDLDFWGLELNPEYIKQAKKRIEIETGLLFNQKI